MNITFLFINHLYWNIFYLWIHMVEWNTNLIIVEVTFQVQQNYSHRCSVIGKLFLMMRPLNARKVSKPYSCSCATVVEIHLWLKTIQPTTSTRKWEILNIIFLLFFNEYNDLLPPHVCTFAAYSIAKLQMHFCLHIQSNLLPQTN